MIKTGIGIAACWLVGLLLFRATSADPVSGAAEGPEQRESTAILPGEAEMEFVWIEPGGFLMGTTEAQEHVLRTREMWEDWCESEKPAHLVRFSQGFYLGKYEVTQGQWERVMETRPWEEQSYVQSGPDRPAVYLSWEDVQAFVQQLNAAAGEVLYRLPTEAEWEYACRAGTHTLWHSGDEPDALGNYAWYRDNAWDSGLHCGQPVGTRSPNPWGLYDMHGNVWEWCQDWFTVDYYRDAPRVDPPGPIAGATRVLRGGAFYGLPQVLRAAFRNSFSPGFRDGHVGARLVKIK